MRPIFTIHAGEYIVGSYLEQKFKQFNIWVPSRDSGVDLLVTDQNNKKAVSLQVKFSKDFLPTHFKELYRRNYKSSGWWKFDSKKISRSQADFWILVLYSQEQKNTQFIIIEPEELLKRLLSLGRKARFIQSYLTVTSKNKCWETRGLKENDQDAIVNGLYKDETRDYTDFLNQWDLIERKLVT